MNPYCSYIIGETKMAERDDGILKALLEATLKAEAEKAEAQFELALARSRLEFLENPGHAAAGPQQDVNALLALRRNDGGLILNNIPIAAPFPSQEEQETALAIAQVVTAEEQVQRENARQQALLDTINESKAMAEEREREEAVVAESKRLAEIQEERWKEEERKALLEYKQMAEKQARDKTDHKRQVPNDPNLDFDLDAAIKDSIALDKEHREVLATLAAIDVQPTAALPVIRTETKITKDTPPINTLPVQVPTRRGPTRPAPAKTEPKAEIKRKLDIPARALPTGMAAANSTTAATTLRTQTNTLHKRAKEFSEELYAYRATVAALLENISFAQWTVAPARKDKLTPLFQKARAALIQTIEEEHETVFRQRTALEKGGLNIREDIAKLQKSILNSVQLLLINSTDYNLLTKECSENLLNVNLVIETNLDFIDKELSNVGEIPETPALPTAPLVDEGAAIAKAEDTLRKQFEEERAQTAAIKHAHAKVVTPQRDIHNQRGAFLAKVAAQAKPPAQGPAGVP
jgi:hypothetical protein